jgi:hypothetical protein
MSDLAHRRAAAALIPACAAIWNGFPLLQYDTGGYLVPWYEGRLIISRAATYGLFLLAGHAFDFWPALIAQALLAVWIVALTLRAHGFGARPGTLLAVIALLSGMTTLPWLAASAHRYFRGLAVLALHLLITAAISCAARTGRLASSVRRCHPTRRWRC